MSLPGLKELIVAGLVIGIMLLLRRIPAWRQRRRAAAGSAPADEAEAGPASAP